MASCAPASTSPRRRDALALALLSLTLASAAACGDDLEPLPAPAGGGDEDTGTECATTEVEEFPEGDFGRPDLVTAEGFDCPEGGLVDADLGGRWSIQGYQNPFIRQSCEEGLDVELEGAGDLLVHLDDTNLFIRDETVTENFSLTFAVRACASPGSDELTAAFGACFRGADDDESQCQTGLSSMKRFGRPPGEGEAEGLELVARWDGGDPAWPASTDTNVKVVDGVAFLSRLSYLDGDVSDLRLIDVSDPENPSDLGSVAGSGEGFADFNDVKLFQQGDGTYAVLAGATSPIVDASSPSSPVVTSEIGEYSHSVFVRADGEGRTLAYLATSGATPDVPIYDVTSPEAPTLLERVTLPPSQAFPESPGQLHDLYATEDRLYLNAGPDGFIIMDREGGEWTEGGRLPTTIYGHASWVGEIEGRLIAIVGDEGYGAHMQVVDVDPASPEFMSVLGTYQTRPEVSIHNMMLFGTRAYVAYYEDGVRIVDLADPSNPELVAYYHTWDVETGSADFFAGAIGIDVDVEAGLIYVADMDGGLIILRETR
jgi:hypothetical protein